MSEVEMNYRKSKIQELAVKKLICDQSNEYTVSQWELDILQLGISFCYNVTRMGELIERNEEQESELTSLESTNASLKEENEKLKRERDSYKQHINDTAWFEASQIAVLKAQLAKAVEQRNNRVPNNLMTTMGLNEREDAELLSITSESIGKGG